MKKLLIMLLFFPVTGSYSQTWEKNYDFVDNCVCGLSRVKKDNKVGYVNKEGVEIIKPQYDDGLTYHEGYTAVKKDNKWLFIDSTGKAITATIFEDAIGFSNGLAAVAKNNLYGFINTTGQVVIDFEFSNARSFAEALAPVANVKGYWGYINTKGTWMVKPIYDFADNFENGEARVIKGEKVFYIDKQGRELHQ
jgi:WG containing repeat